MLKVFLVEDEVIIRNGVKNNIPWEENGFLFVGEASDGELAWPLIKNTQPDILITDIRMPFMDGLELAGLVRRELPDTKIIILSGYSEFDYAKQAISLGVANYLLKPINSEKLLEAVKEVAERIEKERERLLLVEQYRKENQENLNFEKRSLFDQIVRGTFSARELLEKGQALDMDLTAAFYTVVLLKLIAGEENHEYSDQVVEMTGQVNAVLAEDAQIVPFDRGQEGWVLLIKSESGEQAQEKIRQLETVLKTLLADSTELHYFGGVGETVQRMRDIRQSWQQSNKAFAIRFFTESDQFVFAEKMERMRPVQHSDLSLDAVDASNVNRKLAEDFLKNGTPEEIDNFVEEYFFKVGAENYRSIMFCHYLIVDMNICACQFLEGLGIDAGLLSAQSRDVNQYSASVQTTEGMKNYVKQLFAETLRLRDGSSGKRYRKLIETAKQYIWENFQNNECSMNQAAAMVNISPSYFSTLFRQEVGMTFVEYLTEVRLEKAKELLMCTDKRSSEIGYEVGYKDSHYFSYIFKKVCGCTPKEYRAGKREGEK